MPDPGCPNHSYIPSRPGGTGLRWHAVNDMAGPSLSERYHAATIYTHDSVQRGSRLDFSAQPSPFKSWYQARRVPLAGGPAEAPRPDAGPLDAARLGRILYHTYGVTLVREFPGMSMHFRAAPSAGALYPTELYVAVRGIDGIPDGILDYHAPDHSLALCWEGDFWRELERFTFGHPAIDHARAVIIGTGVFERSAWRYSDRAYRRVLLDTGHVFGNAQLAAPQFGQHAVPIPSFMDDGIDSLLLLDAAQEGTVLLTALVDAEVGPFDAPSALRSATATETADPTEGSWIPVVHSAGRMTEELASADAHRPDPGPAAVADPIELNGEPLAGGRAVLETIRRRRSTRRFQPKPERPPTLGVVGRLLAHAYPGRPEVAGGSLDPDLLDTYVIVANVAGLGAGVYRYDAADHALALVRPGNPRSALHECSLRQQLGYDCSFAVVHSFDLRAAVLRLGDRAYRTAHLEAGMIGQRLNIGSLQLGFGASGIGGFFDDCVNALIGLGPMHAIAYITTVGVPG